MQKTGIFYGSTSGNTENVAKQIQAELGADNADVFDVSSAGSNDLEQYSNLIFGVSTWGVGDLQDDFEDFMSEIKSAGLEGKKIALFGLGDQDGYADSFVDGIGEIYETLKDKNCDVIGFTSTDGFDFSDSRGEVDGQFVGLAIDEDNQSDLTDSRVKDWVARLKEQFN